MNSRGVGGMTPASKQQGEGGVNSRGRHSKQQGKGVGGVNSRGRHSKQQGEGEGGVNSRGAL